MTNNKVIVFGGEYDESWLSSETVNELLDEAYLKTRTASEPDIECILEILDSVSKAWADPEYHLRKKAVEFLPSLTSFSQEMIEEGLNVVSAICARKNLEKRISGEIGSLEALNDGEERPHHNYRLKAKPRGIILHLSAGNVFVGAVDSLISGIITKNVNILKMSGADPVFPILFLESIKEFDPAGIIWTNQAVVHWKGGDRAIEDALFNSRLTLVFWGGHEALESLKPRLGRHIKLIENGPRYSFAVIEGKCLKPGVPANLIRNLALDVCRWDQQACSSPHVIYVIDKDLKTSHQLIEALFDVMLEVCEELPCGRLNFDEKVEIRKVREIARMMQVRSEGRLVCPEEFSFTLVLEYDPSFKISCLNRTLFIKRVSNMEDLVEQLSPFSDFLQTAGICCTTDSTAIFEKELFGLGVKRITDIGGMSEGHDGAPHEGSFILRDLVEWVAVEYKNDYQSRIERLLKKISSSPYYNRLIEEAGGCSYNSFLKLPLLDRETFYRISPPESDDILTGPMTDAYVYASGGTTGNPKFTFYSNKEYRYVTDLLTEVYRNAGISHEDRVANLFIAGNLWTSFNVAGRALENLGCLHLPIGGSSDIENILKYIGIFNANAVVGLPSIIIRLAEEIQKRSLDIKFDKILYAGEHLRPQTCEFLKKAVGAKIIRSAGYACVDTGIVGWQCPHTPGTIHHVLEDYCYCEIISTTDQSVIEDDTPGEIVVTNLDHKLQPIVRYRTGDLGRWIEQENCPCGFKGKSFELLGRCDDLIVVGGINLMPADVEAGLSSILPSRQFQIIARTVNAKDQICIRIESDKEFSEKQIIDALVKGSYKIAESIKEQWATIAIEQYELGKLPKNPRTGKIKAVIDERS